MFETYKSSTKKCILLGRILFLVLIFGFVSNCVTHQFQSPYSEDGILLAGWEKQCETERSFTQWYLFWGSYPINKIDEKEFFPSKAKSYKFSIKTTWLDGVITTLGGSTISLTRKTLVISECTN